LETGLTPQRLTLSAVDGTTCGTLAVPEKREAARLLLVCIHGGGCNGGYFTLGSPSVFKAALARGVCVLLVDRPAHGGSSAGTASERPIRDSLPRIRAFIDWVREEHVPGTGLALIGHSIGGAIALMLAADRRDWPLRGVAVSGIGDEPTPLIRDWWADPDAKMLPPGGSAVSLFLGPEGTYGWQAPITLRRVSEPWILEESAEIVRTWPGRWPGIAAAIDVPVHLRLAEHDNIWVAREEVVARMAARLAAAPAVDAAILPEGGHLYEIHKRGGELVEAQLDFLTARAEALAR